MAYNTQNYCVFRLSPLSGILNTRERNVSETGSVSSSGGGDTYSIPVIEVSPF
jgi:hypothetical protein